MSGDSISAVSSQSARPAQSNSQKESSSTSTQQVQASSQAASVRAASSPEAQGKDRPVQTPKKVESSTAQQEARKKSESSEVEPKQRRGDSKVNVVA